MGIKIVEDVGAPAVVTAVDLITLEVAPTWNEWLSYIMAGVGYVGAGMGFGGAFVKNIGIAALPLAARNIRNRIKAPVAQRVGTASRLAFRPAPVSAGPVRREYQPEFQQAGAHAW